jgi:hypothetical protein
MPNRKVNRHATMFDLMRLDKIGSQITANISFSSSKFYFQYFVCGLIQLECIIILLFYLCVLSSAISKQCIMYHNTFYLSNLKHHVRPYSVCLVTDENGGEQFIHGCIPLHSSLMSYSPFLSIRTHTI